MNTDLLQALMQSPKLENITKLLCIQPHPDDNEIGMGGIIADLVTKGVTVDYLTITDGSLGDIGLTDGSIPLKEVRKAEAIKAGKYLGVSAFYFLDKIDGSLNDVPQLAKEIAEIIREGGYDAIAAPDPYNTYEAHYDHIITGRAAAQAAISVNLKEYPKGTKTQPATLKAVLFYFTQKPNTIVDITSVFHKKIEAVALHKSQISPQLLELYSGYFAFRGQKLTASEKIGEGVKALLPLHLHCIAEADEI